MNRPYDSIPRAGGPHLKKIDRKHSSLNVSAPPAPDFDKRPVRKKQGQTFQLSYNEVLGSYRVNMWKSGTGKNEEGYTELSRHSTTTELASTLDDASSSLGYVVLENSDTGEVFLEQELNLRGDWTQEGRFDRITTFADEEAAVAYADQRKK